MGIFTEYRVSLLERLVLEIEAILTDTMSVILGDTVKTLMEEHRAYHRA